MDAPILSPAIQTAIHQCVLCWLATSDAQGQPNVSPKEIFCTYGRDQILMANIASPQSMRNIRENPRVCVSVLDILVQKGWQLKGSAHIVAKNEAAFPALSVPLRQLTGGKFPFHTLFAITIDQAKPILAPRYLLYPDTTEAEQVAAAKQAYGF